MLLWDIFRPTWEKLAWTVGLGLPVTLLGLHIAGLDTRHSPPLILIGAVCLLPHFLLWWLVLSHYFVTPPAILKWTILPIVQFLYFYVPVCLTSFIFRRLRGRVFQRQEPLG